VDGIPILIRNHEEHFKNIEQLKASIKGAWYSQTQVDYYDRGPYRHSLRKRKAIVQSWVDICCGELLGKAPDRRLTVLDHGCGDGASSRWLDSALPESSKLLLTDYNFERIVRARNLLGTDNKEYFLSQVTRAPLFAGSIDLVFSNHVIEHVLEDQTLLEEIYRILRPGGFLILGCPNSGVFFWMLAYALSPATIRKSDHIHFYDSRTLIKMGQNAALEHLRTRHTGYGFPHYKLDLLIRRFKIINDLFDVIGRMFFPGQASSLYLMFRKN
jgi:ubiquinone/menaquinone biosynthesis C-methylase UbiE